MTLRDRRLGMDRPITRRDFLGGTALALGAGVLCSRAQHRRPAVTAAHPPALTGLRGSHEGSYEVAHAVKDGVFWENAGEAEETGEGYDLVVVGGGISGLAAARFFSQAAGGSSRILILDNHDDFGGHARRNEFRVGDRLVLGYGGAQSIDSPRRWSATAAGLLRELGVDTRRFHDAFDARLYAARGMGTGAFFDGRRWGRDHLAPGVGRRPWAELLAAAPLAPEARRDLARVHEQPVDYLAGLGPAEKRERLARTSYRDYLAQFVGLHPEALEYLQDLTHDLWGLGIDGVAALECSSGGDDYGRSYPGFEGLGLEPGAGQETPEPYIFHFPDGNASLARLLVRALVPAALPGESMDDVVTARADYRRLDDAAAPVRIRLASTVVRVRHRGEPTRSGLEVSYVRDGRLQRVGAERAVLACWNRMIPHLCPELPARQREALDYGVKVPLVYVNALLRTWSSFERAGVHQLYAPGGYYSWQMLDFPVSLGSYRFSAGPEEPIVLFLLRTPCSPGLSAREQHKVGRLELLATGFDRFELELREQLARAYGPFGLDPARDLLAVTVNRWPHGYAYQPSTLWDPNWPAGEEPHVLGRRRFGRIAIAGSDAGARAYADAAIDQAWRAVSELLALDGVGGGEAR